MRGSMYFITLVVLGIVSTHRVQAAEWEIPGDNRQISLIIPSTASGDTISVLTGFDPQRPIYVNKSLLIRNTTGSPVTILSDTDSMAVDVAASGVVIDGGSSGFLITGASGPSSVVDLFNATMKNCNIEDSGYAYATDGVVHIALGGKLLDCTIDLSSTSSAYAIEIETTSGAEVSNCTITSAKNSAGGDYEAVIVNANGATLSNNTIEFTQAGTNGAAITYLTGTSCTIEDNLILGAVTHGIRVSGSGAVVNGNIIDLATAGNGFYLSGSGTLEKNTVFADTTCMVGSTGIYVASSSGTSTVNNNLFYNVDYGVYYNTGTTDSFSHNIFWGSCGDSSNRSLSSSQISTKEPLFCDAQEGTESFTQRIDSHAAPGNNGWGELVGARDIECAWGTLARNTTVPKSRTVKMLRDVTVSSGKTLTVAHDVSFLVDDDDDGVGGSDTAKNELIVSGTLTVTGKADSLVEFFSSKASPGESDWRGIDVKGDATAHVDHADVRNAVYGVLITGPDTASVTNSAFSSNGTFDVVAAGGGYALSVLVSDNTITVGGGSGVVINDSPGGCRVEDNTVNGSSSSTNGIWVGYSTTGAVATLKNNTVDGLSAGAGIRNELAASSPTLTSNHPMNNKWGIYVAGGSPTIGTLADTTLDNVCTGNSTSGMFFTGSSTTGTVRQSRCTGNGTGIITKGNANPDLGSSANVYNILVPNTTYCLWNQSTSGTVSAQGNYIGGCSPPPGVCWNGSFDLTSALCSVPSEQVFAVEPVPRFRLLGPRPNPLVSSTSIHFAVGAENTRVGASVFDISGRLVRTIGEQKFLPGDHRIVWDGTNDAGRAVSSGLYFIRVSVDDISREATKILVAR